MNFEDIRPYNDDEYHQIITELFEIEPLMATIDNYLTEVPVNALKGLSSLNGLSIANNYITKIPTNAFAGLSSLRGLGLSKNKITAIDENAFAGLGSLVKLQIYSNPIQEISRSRVGLGPNVLVKGVKINN